MEYIKKLFKRILLKSEKCICPHDDIRYVIIRDYLYDEMTDNDDLDEKIIAIPKSDPFLKNCKDIKDLPEQYSAEIMHFFEVYKQLEGKTTTIEKILGREEAEKIIQTCIDSYNKKFVK